MRPLPTSLFVIPAKAGIQRKNQVKDFWIPAFAGMTEQKWILGVFYPGHARLATSLCRLLADHFFRSEKKGFRRPSLAFFVGIPTYLCRSL
jgi:hypothetical protein